MDLGLKAFECAIHLKGIAPVLRRIYRPRFEIDASLRAALDAIAAREHSRLPEPEALATAT